MSSEIPQPEAEQETQKTALIFGGNGSVGSSLVSHFKLQNYVVISIAKWKPTNDEIETHVFETCTQSCHVYIIKNPQNDCLHKDADINILMHEGKSLKSQEDDLIKSLKKILGENKLDVIICAAGGFDMGSISDDFIEKFEAMSRQNVYPAILTVSIVKNFVKESGFVCFFGAKTALVGTPACVAYGASKSVVHSLTKSLASSKNHLPNNVLVLAVLPITIDTFINRQNMPDSDVSAWTPTKYIVDLLFKWVLRVENPPNGSMVEIYTKNFITAVKVL